MAPTPPWPRTGLFSFHVCVLVGHGRWYWTASA
jgi:hypothetical protein